MPLPASKERVERKVAAVPRFVPRLKLGEEVTRYLRDAIMSGEYVAGERIRLEELADRLDVSTMPAREALTALVIEGLLEALPRRGYRVVSLQQQDIEDVFRVHAFIAGILAERAAKTMSREKIAQLRAMQVEAEQVKADLSAEDRAVKIEEVNFRFHATVNREPAAPRLRWFLRAATRYVPRRFYLSIPTWRDATVQEHPAIIDALEKKNGATARRLVERHIQKAGEQVIEHFASSGAWHSGHGGAGIDVHEANLTREVATR
jgi:DNA-binding GntR family transcriptional regulator